MQMNLEETGPEDVNGSGQGPKVQWVAFVNMETIICVDRNW
jgi:hypothetical protein